MQLQGIDRKGRSILGVENEATHICEEGVSHVPFRMFVAESNDRPFRSTPLTCGVCENELGTNDAEQHPNYTSSDKPQVSVGRCGYVQAQHGVCAYTNRNKGNPEDVESSAIIWLLDLRPYAQLRCRLMRQRICLESASIKTSLELRGSVGGVRQSREKKKVSKDEQNSWLRSHDAYLR